MFQRFSIIFEVSINPGHSEYTHVGGGGQTARTLYPTTVEAYVVAEGINGRYPWTECPRHRHFAPLVQRLSHHCMCPLPGSGAALCGSRRGGGGGLWALGWPSECDEALSAPGARQPTTSCWSTGATGCLSREARLRRTARRGGGGREPERAARVADRSNSHTPLPVSPTAVVLGLGLGLAPGLGDAEMLKAAIEEVRRVWTL